MALALSEADLPVLLVYARTAFLQEPHPQSDIHLPKSLQVGPPYSLLPSGGRKLTQPTQNFVRNDDAAFERELEPHRDGATTHEIRLEDYSDGDRDMCDFTVSVDRPGEAPTDPTGAHTGDADVPEHAMDVERMGEHG